MISFLLSGLLLGLSGGLSPGPLTTLVTSETLQHGTGAGIRIALAPLITDLPIILVTLLLLQPLAEQTVPLALIHGVGGLYLGWLGVQGMRFQGADLGTPDLAIHSFRRGVLANFLNPSPYLFWLAVGAPIVLKAWQQGWPAAVAFVAAFYGLLVGSKVVLAFALGRTRHLLRSSHYKMVMRGLGVLLLIYGLVFLYEGGRLLMGG